MSRLVILLMVATMMACAGPQASSPGSQARSADSPRATKRIVAAIQGDPHTVYQQLNPASRVRGIDALQQIVGAGLTEPSGSGTTIPQLAESVPTIDNGLWKVLADGSMETTWRIRDGVQWHDGTPFTSQDIVFTAKVVSDRELPIFNDSAYDLMVAVEAPDPRTVVVRWKEAFIEADSLFSHVRAMPMPKHLLEGAYNEDKAGFADHAYWSQQYVGVGPFKIRDWMPGSHMIFVANERYALGRPKLDEVEVRFIPDANTLMANILSGTVELTLGRSISGEQAIQVRDQWSNGRMMVSPEATWIALYPQLLTPNPAVVGDLSFRKALMYATDRQQMVDVFLPGLALVAHSWIGPGQDAFREIEARQVVRYDHNPARARQLLDEMGLARGPDGMLRDRAGQPLSVELRTTDGDDLRLKMIYTTTDDWRRVGVGVDIVVVPRQLAADLEYRATFPAFELVRQPTDARGSRNLHSRTTPLPENNFRVVGNRSRYFNADFDTLVDRYFRTIPKGERDQLMGQIAHEISDKLIIMGQLYTSTATLVSKRALNIEDSRDGTTQAWNAHDWDVSS